MLRTPIAPAPTSEPKTHRSARTSRKKPAGVTPAAAAKPEFDAAAHHPEIARLAYLNWLERVGSPEEDWRKAEIEVRAKYTR